MPLTGFAEHCKVSIALRNACRYKYAAHIKPTVWAHLNRKKRVGCALFENIKSFSEVSEICR